MRAQTIPWGLHSSVPLESVSNLTTTRMTQIRRAHKRASRRRGSRRRTFLAGEANCHGTLLKETLLQEEIAEGGGGAKRQQKPRLQPCWRLCSHACGCVDTAGCSMGSGVLECELRI